MVQRQDLESMSIEDLKSVKIMVEDILAKKQALNSIDNDMLADLLRSDAFGLFLKEHNISLSIEDVEPIVMEVLKKLIARG